MKYRPVKWRVGERSDYEYASDIIQITELAQEKFVVCYGTDRFNKQDKWEWSPQASDRAAEFVERTTFDLFEDAAKAADRAYELYVKQGGRHE